jgi:error-prone DNA polymerase
MSYVELHAHSAFSFLDGASLPDELAGAAAAAGYSACALTDHNSVSGSMEFAVAAQALGFKAIHGAELTLDDDRHLTLLVQDASGWRNLSRLLTKAHAHTRDVRPGAPPAPPHVALSEVLAHAEGLVALSGCATHGVSDEPGLLALREAFGVDRMAVELQRPFLQNDRARNRRLAWLAQEVGVPTVATGNVHAHDRARAPLQDAFVAITNHTTLDASEPLRRGNFSHVLAPPGAMAARFPEFARAVAQSAELAAQLDFDLTVDLGYRYPGAEDPTTMRRLAELCAVRFERRYGEAAKPAARALRSTAAARLEEELRIIESLNLGGFFLLHHDMLELARDVAVEVRGPDTARALLPPGRGRGSSVSSIVCYLTGLSHVDPIANELLIGRFLNEDLNALPDIDLDFPRDIRAVLIPRIHERYGPEQSALVAAFPTYRARGAIRELGKALGLPPGEIERVARSSEGWDARKVGTDIEGAYAGRTAVAGRWRWLAHLAAQAHGLPRHLSQHSGGMIVATRPLIDCCPIVPAAMEGRQIVQWDKDSCADAGFLKIDLLGLGMLSAVERCVEMIGQRRGERIDLSTIPYDDPETYAAVQAAETTGVFQIESRAQMQSLRRTRPETLADLTIQVAIVRPGPIQGGAVNPYIDRKQRLREDSSFQVPYLHESLRGPLEDTLGTIIFQDQVLEVAVAFAGFSLGQAEGLRRAMSKKRSEAAIEAHHVAFVGGAIARHGVSEELAEQVFAMVRGFSGFGFPKAHGAAFGLLAYQSTWLRVHYAPEFLCALLNEQPMGFYPPDALVHEAQRRGLVVHAPDVNRSGVECAMDADGAVRVGLGYVRGVRREEVEALVLARDAGGPFADLSDLASRAGAGAPAMELLAWSGACDSLVSGVGGAVAGVGGAVAGVGGAVAGVGGAVAGVGGAAAGWGLGSSGVSPRRHILWQLGIATPGRRVAGGVQLSLPLGLPTPPELKLMSGWESMLADYASTGLTASAHPMALLRRSGRVPADAPTSVGLEALAHGQRVRVGGLVVARQRPGTASGVVFVLLEDEVGVINLVVPPPIYERHRLLVRTEPLLLVEGKLERYAAGGGVINVLVDAVGQITAPDRLLAQIKDFSMLDEMVRVESAREVAAEDGNRSDGVTAEDFRAVAPAVMSFGVGRRR